MKTYHSGFNTTELVVMLC